jgi:hypothetical protein
VRLEQAVDELLDLGEGELGRRMGIEHRRVVDVLALALERRSDGQGWKLFCGERGAGKGSGVDRRAARRS